MEQIAESSFEQACRKFLLRHAAADTPEAKGAVAAEWADYLRQYVKRPVRDLVDVKARQAGDQE